MFHTTYLTYGVTSTTQLSNKSLLESTELVNASIQVQYSKRKDFCVDEVLAYASRVKRSKRILAVSVATLKNSEFYLGKWTCSIAEKNLGFVSQKPVNLTINSSSMSFKKSYCKCLESLSRHAKIQSCAYRCQFEQKENDQAQIC